MSIALLAAAVSAAAAATDSGQQLPSPLDGPGRPQLERSDQRRIEKALKALARGKPDSAAQNASRAGVSAPAELLRLQIRMLDAGEAPLAELQQMTVANPEYAAAWATLAVAAERSGDAPNAYPAARRVAELWPGSRWAALADDFRRRWVEEPVAEARRRLEENAPEDALDLLAVPLSLEPALRDGRMVEAAALLRLGRLGQAEAVLVDLGEDPDALLLHGEIAERRRDWQTAMDVYSRLPADHPGRGDALHRAQLNWRLSVLPSYVQATLASPELTRAEFAVLMVALVPQVGAVGGGRVPLLSDIMDLPSQREMVTVVRLGLMEVDELEHRFFPDRPVTADEVRAAIDRLAEILGAEAPVWCEPPAVVHSCSVVTAPVSGRSVAELVLALAHGSSE